MRAFANHSRLNLPTILSITLLASVAFLICIHSPKALDLTNDSLPLITPRTNWNTSFSVAVQSSGNVQIKVNSSTFSLISFFSHPEGISLKPGFNAFSTQTTADPLWRPVVKEIIPGATYHVTAKGQHYSLIRMIEKKGSKIYFTDSFSNPTTSDVGIVMKNYVRLPSTQYNPNSIRLGGIPVNKGGFEISQPAGKFKNPNGLNSTFYYTDGTNSIGLFAEDNIYRVHASEQFEVGAVAEGGIVDDQFLLKSGASFTRTWAAYPTGSSDYYDFINVLRKDLKVNFRLDGSSITADIWSANSEQKGFFRNNNAPSLYIGADNFWGTTELSKNYLQNYLRTGGIKYVLLYIPRTRDFGGATGVKRAFGSALLTEIAPEETSRLKKIIERIRSQAPEVQVLLYLDRWLNSEEQAPAKYPDSTLLVNVNKTQYSGTLTGGPAGGTETTYSFKGFINDPGRSYTAQLPKIITWAMSELKVNGIYFDEMEGIWGHVPGWGKGEVGYTHPALFRRFYSYGKSSQSDQNSADINPSTFAITAQKADISISSLITQSQMVEQITRLGGVMVANYPPITRESMAFHFPRFVETNEFTDNQRNPEGQALAMAHLFSPIGYGQSIKSDKDITSTIRNYLNYGGLLYYSLLPYIGSNNPMQKIYPVTPLELHAGYIIGAEKTITIRSGKYGWNDSSRLTVSIYDENGTLIPRPTNVVLTSENGKSFAIIHLAPKELAIIERAHAT